MTLHLLSTGIATPAHSIAQADAAHIVKHINGRTDKQRHFIEEVYLHAGVERRGSVLLHSSDGPLPTRQAFFQPPATDVDLGPTTAARMQQYVRYAPQLAVAAAHQALQESGLNANEITHFVTVSCTGFHSPGFDLALVPELGLPSTVARTHVGYMGCHAALNASTLR